MHACEKMAACMRRHEAPPSHLAALRRWSSKAGLHEADGGCEGACACDQISAGVADRAVLLVASPPGWPTAQAPLKVRRDDDQACDHQQAPQQERSEDQRAAA